MYKNIQQHLEAYKTASTELAELQEKLKPLQEKAKELVQAQAEHESQIDAEMQKLGETKFAVNGFSVSYRKSSALKIYDETKIPAQFFVQVPKRLDAEIKKAIQNGMLIDGCEIEERQNLQIKL